MRLGDRLADVPCVALRRPICGCGDVPCVADVPSIAFGRPSCGCAFRCVGAANFRTCLPLHWGTQRFRCGSVFHLGAHLANTSGVAFGHPSCGRTSHCVGVPNLGEAVLKCLPPSQNLFLSILQVVFSPSAPFCGRFSLQMSFSFGRPSCEIALRCVWEPILRTHLA